MARQFYFTQNSKHSMSERFCKTPQELEDEAFVKAAFVNTKQQRKAPLERDHDPARLGRTSNSYLKTNFASKLAQLEISLDDPKKSCKVDSLHKPQAFIDQAASRQRAAARLYEMRLNRSHASEKPAQTSMHASEEESDRISIMSVGSTPSGISEASTKISRVPLSKSFWRPLQMSRDLVRRRVQGAGLLHVAGSNDVNTSLRDTYQEPKKDSMDETTHSDNLRNLIRECTNAKELRRLLKLTVQIVPQYDTTENTKLKDLEAQKPKSSSLDSAQQVNIFDKLKILQQKADAYEIEARAQQTNDDHKHKVVLSSSCSMDKSPEVKARFQRLDLLSKHAEKAFENTS